MNLMQTVKQTLPAHMANEVETAKAFINAQHSEATRKAYVSDAKVFAAWCNSRGLAPFPATPEMVATFIATEAANGIKYATISRRVAAIRYAHKMANLESPTHTELVKAALAGIRRTVGIAKTQKTPATADKVTAMLDNCPATLTGLRDKALLSLGFAGAFRRSELVALEVGDIQFTEEGLKVTIRKSKTDQEGAGQTIAIPSGSRIRVVENLKAWVEAAAITAGPIFRPIAKGGKVQEAALSTKSVAEIVKAYATKAGLNAAEFAGHSLRAGFLTSAAENGANIFKMMEVSRHKSMETVRGYVRNAELFKNHAGAAFL